MVEEVEKKDTFSSDESFDDEEDSDSSTDIDAKLEEEDVFDIDFFKCYSALKKRDDKIYDKSYTFFNDKVSSESEDDSEQEPDTKPTDANELKNRRTRSAPKMTLLDHQLRHKQEDIEEPLAESIKSKFDHETPVSKSYYEKELEEIKKNIEAVSKDIDSESDDDLLMVKKTEDGPSTSLRPRHKFSTLVDDLEGYEDEDLSHIKKIWSDPDNLSTEDKFLRDYILNKRYIASNAKKIVDGSKDFFSNNIDDLSDAESDATDEEESKKSAVPLHHSDEQGFDKIARVPRNSTKTIRDLVEKRDKKEKRMKKLEKDKKKKKALKNADCEDIVGDLQIKFNYRETEPNDYGLTAVELLMATDEELEKWVKLRDAIKFKTPEEELAHKRRFEKRGADLELKKTIFKSVYADGEDEEEGDVDVANELDKERGSIAKGKRKRGKTDGKDSEEPDQGGSDDNINQQESEVEQPRKKKKKHKRGTNHKKIIKTGVAPDRLLAYGLSKKKLRKSKLL